MITIKICVGSSCHVKGSQQVIAKLREQIAKYNLEDKVNLEGMFCTENCQKGVCVAVNEAFFSLSPDTTENFFEEEILPLCEEN